VVVLFAPTDPMGFRKSTRDTKAQSAAEEHTNEARGGGGVCLGFEDPTNHWTKRITSIRLATFF